MINLIKKLPFYRRYTTNQNLKYWQGRAYGWEEYFETFNHPHRHFISHILKQINWFSLLEIGCGSGPNIANVLANIPNRQLGGIDINQEAINVCQKKFKHGMFKCCSAEDMMLSDKSADILLTDMFLIYVGPLKIKKYLKEIRRVARNYVVLCEYNDQSWWRRQYLRVFSGRHAYDYKRLLEKLGFWDIQIIKMPTFEEDNEQRYRQCIVAKVPKVC